MSIFRRDKDSTVEAIDALAVTNRVAHNVAERLLTGRRAEEYFLEHSLRLVNVNRSDVLDFRQAARGFYFGVRKQQECAIEIKGLRSFGDTMAGGRTIDATHVFAPAVRRELR